MATSNIHTGAVSQYNFPTRIRYGAGVRNELAKALKEKGLKKVLVVTDRGLASLPVFEEFMKVFDGSGLDVKVFSGIWGNPVKSQVTAGTEAAKEHGADSIVAIGGGAALDCAKIIGLMMHHPGDLFDYEDRPGSKPVDREMPYIVGIPTTAGTGSEVGRSSVVSDDDTHEKKIIFDPRLLAQLVLADPELTLALPASMTAATGMDALTHLIEAYLAKGYHPLADGIALEGIRMVTESLPEAVRYAKEKPGQATPEHLKARGMMLNASMMGAIAFQKGLGVTHSCAHALSTVCDLHHGTANGILLPYAMAYNAETEGPRFVAMARAVGLADPTPKAFIEWTIRFKKEVGIAATLAEVGVKKDHLPKLIDIAERDGCHPSNPRPVSREDFERIFLEAMGEKKFSYR